MDVDRGMRPSFLFCQRAAIGSVLLQAHFRLVWPSAVFALLLLGGVGRANQDVVMAQTSPASASTTRDGSTKLLVTQEDGRTFKLLRQGLPAVRVTFLTSRTVRIHSIGNEPRVNLPEYIRVKTDRSYPPIKVNWETRDFGATFKTPDATVELVLEQEGAVIRVGTPAQVLLKNWRIDALRRTAALDLEPDEHIYGFGDKRAALDQRGYRVEIINRDAFASETNESYKSIPFYISSKGYGLFFHNFYPSVFDVGSASRGRLQLRSTAGDMDFYLFVGEPKDVISQYTELTGRPAMLPRWAFGYHQAKATYKGREALTVAGEMRKRQLPVDVIYYDGWDKQVTGKEFIDALWSQHRVRLTYGFGMPMFGKYPGTDDSELVQELGSRRYLMVDQSGLPSIAPDRHVDESQQESAVGYLDYFSPSAVDHVFNFKWDGAIRNGAILGMVDFGEMDHLPNAENKFWPSLGLSVAQTRNLYGLVYPLSIINGVQKRNGGGRLTGMVRPGFAGTQRLGWSTTGDSVPTYRNFRAHTRAMINLTLSGFSNVGQDIGGWDRKGPDVLYARWFAAGTFHPFMWSHGQGDHEPYSHGAKVEAAAREFLELRYRLVPYFYSLHEHAHRTGIPVMRAFPLQEPDESLAHRIDDQYFIGDNVMVAPLFNDEGSRKLYLPKGLWYDFFNEETPEAGRRETERRAMPLDRLPVYVRAGAVIPLGPVMQHTGEKPVDPLFVHVYSFGAEEMRGGARKNEFELYEDDGVSNEYRKRKFQRTKLRFAQSNDTVRFEIRAESGDRRYWAVSSRAYVLRFHGIHAPVRDVRLDGKGIPRAAKEPRTGAYWELEDKSGDVIVSIPRSSKRKFAVQFATASAWSCSDRC
jgi:alpha-glucosidase